MLHRIKIVSLMQTVAKPFIQESIHHPFLLDHVRDVKRAVCTWLKLLNFNHPRVVVNLQMQIWLEQGLPGFFKLVCQPQHRGVPATPGN